MEVTDRKKTRKGEFIHCTRIGIGEGGAWPVQEV